MVCPACGATNDDAAEVCFTCRAVLAALTRGSLVAGRYEVLSLLGRGGMGTVYKARDRTLDEVVALKVLRSEIALAPEMAERFRSEIRLARRVSQRNVCRIHEYGEEDGLCYIAMEWIEGTNLKQALKERGGLPTRDCFEVSLQVAEGLRAIHEAGIIHRDLTTPNIMLGADGVTRILDFGIAKRVVPEGATHPTAAGYVLGSPEYMSPEQARGRPVDYRTDIYSFGVVLFEIATGRVPFRAETPVATLLLHVEAPPPLEGASIPAALVPILRTALAKDPGQRYPKTDDLIEALQAARAETLSGTRIPGRSHLGRSGTTRLARRSRTAGIALSLVLAAVAGMLASRWSRSPAPEPNRNSSATGPASPVPNTSAPSSPAPTDDSPGVRSRSPVSPSPYPSPPTSGERGVAGGPRSRSAGERVVTSLGRPDQTGSPTPAPEHKASIGGASPEPGRKSSARGEVLSASPSPTAPSPGAASPEPGQKSSARGEVLSASPPPTAASPGPVEIRPVPSPAAPEPTALGMMRVAVTPWADVSIDRESIGQTPMADIRLAPGTHSVVLTHPDYQPYPRIVKIRSGELYRLIVHLETEGVRRRP